MAKQWHVAHAVEAGRSAARFAQMGGTGPRQVLEGPQGLFAAMCATANPLLLSDQWLIDRVSFKPWAACRHAHPAIDAALVLRRRGRLTLPVQVETYRDAIDFCDRPEPATETEAKFSLQHAVAVIADGRACGPADFTPEAIAALASLRAQVRVREDPRFTARYPAHFGARLSTMQTSAEVIDTLGDPECPIGEDGLIAKARALADWGGLSPDQAEQMIDTALDGDDPGAIVRLLEDWLR